MITEITPCEAIHRKWAVDSSYPFQITIITADKKLRVARLFHSGFGVSENDHKLAEQIVEDHNARIEGRSV